MTDYKFKLKALLHDPINKQYVMWCLRKNHEEVAKNYLNKILYEESREDLIKDADSIASAINRIIVAPKDENLRRKIDSIEIKCDEIEFIDFFSLKRQKAGLPEDEEEVEKFFERLGSLTFENPEERAKICFLFLWRFLPEIFPWINTHPADSRAPNHSIYDHLVQTSAIVSCLPKPAFLIFTIAPVQEFISKARKTMDLWSGSYFLSYLIFKAIEVILEDLGPDNVIYPNLLKEPLVDKWLYKKFKDSPIEANFKDEDYFKKFIDNCFFTEKLAIANFPNRFVAIIPHDKDLPKKVEKKVKEVLEEVSRNLPKFLIEKIQAHSKLSEEEKDELKSSMENLKLDEQIKNHLLSYFQIYWVILPWTSGVSYLPDEALKDYEKIISNKTEVYKTVKLITEHPFYKPPLVGSAYSLLLGLTERLLGARKSLRNYIENNFYESEGEKCHLCGEFEVLLLNQKDNKKAWNRLPGDIVKEGERLCGLCLTKRLLPKIIKEKLNLNYEMKFPSTSEIASIGEKRRLEEKVKKDFKEKFDEFLRNKNWKLSETASVPKLKRDPLFYIDGQWLMKESYRVEYFRREFGFDVDQNDFKAILDFLEENKISPSRYYAILMVDGDNIGKWLKGEFNPKIEEVLNDKMKDILRGLNDTTLNEILCSKKPVSASIHQNFSRKLTGFALEEVRKIVEEDYHGKLVYAGGDDVLAFLPIEDILECSYKIQEKFKEILSPKASMSAGIVIVHHKYPLYLALEELRNAEKMAKEKFERDAFCIRLIRHSGDIRETGGKWRLIEFMKDLICKFETKKLPSRFTYEFLEVVEEIKGEEILKGELKRIYYRKVEKEMKDYLYEIIEKFDEYKYDKIYFANMFLISKFFADERRV
ncbi:MAG: type III-B CRISPR-associated protein Cas10/Cmr2 [candidate division WOR-3 bacterium]